MLPTFQGCLGLLRVVMIVIIIIFCAFYYYRYIARVYRKSL